MASDSAPTSATGSRVLGTMVEIDGAHGVGGCQLARTAVAVAAAKGVPVRIASHRAGRRVPLRFR